MNAQFQLVKYDAACRALAEAKSVDEVKGILDVAVMMAAYARMAENTEMEADAWEIRTRAQRRLGELIAAQWDTVGKASGRPKITTEAEVISRPTLADAGVGHKLSSTSQQIASIPGEEFEAAIVEGRAAVAEGRERASNALFSRVSAQFKAGGNTIWNDGRAQVDRPREPIDAVPRKPQELQLPIEGPTDLLAQMIGVREAEHVSQSEYDARMGRDGWNYVSKLEKGIRQPFDDSFWDWLAAAGRKMYLLPIVADKCPCCGKVTTPIVTKV